MTVYDLVLFERIKAIIPRLDNVQTIRREIPGADIYESWQEGIPGEYEYTNNNFRIAWRGSHDFGGDSNFSVHFKVGEYTEQYGLFGRKQRTCAQWSNALVFGTDHEAVDRLADWITAEEMKIRQVDGKKTYQKAQPNQEEAQKKAEEALKIQSQLDSALKYFN